MDLQIVREINKLWIPVYADLCKQIVELCQQSPRELLEIGCFSGGIGLELLSVFPAARLTVAMPEIELIETFEEDWKDLIDDTKRDRFGTIATSLNSLNFDSGRFDLIVSRGVFFFLDSHKDLLAEISRVLASNGVAFVGGGFGSHTTKHVIDEIADESRRLNFALGKRVVSRDEFHRILEGAGLRGRFKIVEDGGLWALISP